MTGGRGTLKVLVMLVMQISFATWWGAGRPVQANVWRRLLTTVCQ
ncbi:hypothetical protein DGI_2586 [Megalodesulfovibrio gigas DSM 1382 = ATCC 19364]|uniref:Uncharacterized protein n=1 Tax=Megalodesulfovibrio gigas (strain ATCC 19364 / DSM 1382 / NCIMB 9332 / VKM B-1759) TaxID=1121448 RepID=T2GDC6_MEGG1|nr:hypothetical protein DGI_2586 [Megalodesulfovibrio gigas DSM 1382 = ATCC 19364]